MIEACNFACSYCFAHWDKPGSVSQALRNAAQLFDQIAGLSGRTIETATGTVAIRSVRLNFAGGEPFLVPSMGEMVAMAHARGLAPSFISNGALIPDRFIEAHAAQLSMAGFSVDAADPVVMHAIGRVDKRGGTLTLPRLADLAARFRAANSAIRVKLNTVVCAQNHAEDLRPAIDLIRPDRWKVLRVLPGNGGDPIPDADWQGFVARHRGTPGMVVEDNADMKGSYLMIDPEGRFFQNTPARGYITSAPILKAGIEAALREIPFHADRFAGRYAA